MVLSICQFNLFFYEKLKIEEAILQGGLWFSPKQVLGTFAKEVNPHWISHSYLRFHNCNHRWWYLGRGVRCSSKKRETPRGSLLTQGKLFLKCKKSGISSSEYLLNHQKALNPSTVCFKEDGNGKYLSGQLSYGHLSKDSPIISYYLLSTHCISGPVLRASCVLTQPCEEHTSLTSILQRNKVGLWNHSTFQRSSGVEWCSRVCHRHSGPHTLKEFLLPPNLKEFSSGHF